jgi:DNA-binding FadR family transcriptional regulator
MQSANISTGLAGYEVRMGLEPYAARRAAENRSAQDLSLIKKHLRQFEKTLRSRRNAWEEDMHLHRSILAATGNPLFLAAFDVVAQQVQEIMVVVTSMTQEDSDKRRAVVVKEHRLVVEAIDAHDGTGAAHAMEQHLKSARRRAIDGFEPGT